MLDPRVTKKEFIEIMAKSEVLDYLVVSYMKEIEEIQRKFNIKVITTKHAFEHNEEFILRMLDSIGNNTTAVELYHSIVAKFNVAPEEKKQQNGTFKLLSRILRRF